MSNPLKVAIHHPAPATGRGTANFSTNLTPFRLLIYRLSRDYALCPCAAIYYIWTRPQCNVNFK